MSWEAEIDELRRREALARQMGGADKVKRQREGGKLTVRERIDQLLDRGSFHEIGAIAGKARYDNAGALDDFMPANFVFGRGRIDGRPVVVGGDDFTVRGGAADRSEEHTSELQSPDHLVCRLLLEKKKKVTADLTAKLRNGKQKSVKALLVSYHALPKPTENRTKCQYAYTC